MPGPVPKRSVERRRRNKVPGETTVVMEGVIRPAPLPRATHPIARRWYNALKASGESAYFEPSDWAAAVYVAEVMTRNLVARKFSAQLFQSVWGAMQDLMTTEAARRRARLEVERIIGGEDETDRPTAIDDYRERLAR